MSEHRRLKLKRREHRKKREEDKRKAAVAAAFLRVPGKLSPSPSTARTSDMLEQVARPLLDKAPEGSGLNDVYSVTVLPLHVWEAAAGTSPEEKLRALDMDVEDKAEHFYITAASIRRPR